jgi:signal transduction histidine kinase/ActR/RegA family two-component response regulator
MARLSIARSLRLALVCLTIALAVVAALGIASLYRARQRYEDTLVRSSSLATAAANLQTAAIAEQEVLREVRGPGAGSARAQAAAAYRAAAATTTSLARGDTASERLLRAELAAGPGLGAGGFAAALESRQRARQASARTGARSETRTAVLLIALGGALAVIAALVLITLLVRSLQRPLDELVDATGALAAGDLNRRVEPSGPRELRELGTVFNAMGDDLLGAQRRVEQERHRLEVTIESLGDALIVTEAGSSAIAAVNPSAARLVPELTVGGAVDAPDSPLPPVTAALSSETIVEHGGRTLAVTAARLGGEAQGVVWTVRDTTERARLERAKSDFVATASHELRSPLTSIKGFVELLHRSPEGMSDRQREFVEIILKSAERLTELVNDLLDVARIEADRVEITRRPIDVGEAVREVTELIGPQLAGKRQTLTVHVAPATGLALADPARVRQIVANLVTNAHLYTGEGGRIDVAVEPDRAWVKLEVRDTGTGMDDEQRSRIFERFYRGPDGSAAPGTGLGLSIVKSLVELHDGQIEVESEPGRGSTFSVRLPAVVELEGTTLAAMRGRRVLVVDDEREIADLIAGQLAPLGVTAEIASSGPQALEMLREADYDAVTLDVLMPGMDGFEVLSAIRADAALHSLPIVFVSVFSGRRELAGEWVVSKPIDADELRQVLGAAVHSGRSRVLVVARPELEAELGPDLNRMGIEHQWEYTGTAAARACAERRFEVALVDVGIRNPQAVLQALDLRGRRRRRAAILFSDGRAPAPPGIGRLGMEVVPLSDAAVAVDAALNAERIR